MVRLSLVNLYLHGFTDPHIYEYDSLTSEERWNEFADVILANPPFMSPKGGIKPHKRFSIQAKRSEVLFVDYMAEHLTAKGRAAIIVPEGIIFQSQTAYKELRKMLVENSLVAVVSLPAGCFNPYSGVKTSILILDKSLAKQSDTIAFFKVENDGFGLGAQRRAIEKNDLPASPGRTGRLPPGPPLRLLSRCPSRVDCPERDPNTISAASGIPQSTAQTRSSPKKRSPRMATTTSAVSGIGRESPVRQARWRCSNGDRGGDRGLPESHQRRPPSVTTDPDWPMVLLKDIAPCSLSYISRVMSFQTVCLLFAPWTTSNLAIWTKAN
jgi:hypothetical protein